MWTRSVRMNEAACAGTTIDPISGLTSAFFSAELRLSQTADFGDNPM